jgi:hypothetical protein
MLQAMSAPAHNERHPQGAEIDEKHAIDSERQR